MPLVCVSQGSKRRDETYQLVKYTALVNPRPWGNVALTCGSAAVSGSGVTSAGTEPSFDAGIACGAVPLPLEMLVGPGAKAAWMVSMATVAVTVMVLHTEPVPSCWGVGTPRTGAATSSKGARRCDNMFLNAGTCQADVES